MLRLGELLIQIDAPICELLDPAALTIECREVKVEQSCPFLGAELPIASFCTTEAWATIVCIACPR